MPEDDALELVAEVAHITDGAEQHHLRRMAKESATAAGIPDAAELEAIMCDEGAAWIKNNEFYDIDEEELVML